MISFTEFFQALWEKDKKPLEPFPWQRMLAEEAAQGIWPEAIQLPTASGKTACIDVALYALAATADQTDFNKRMPRRIWFVVDRRIVVDEAFERAREIAKKLASAQNGPLEQVANRLRELCGVADRTGKPKPLAVARLRGGAWRDEEGWARIPSQPAVICSTVDQVGSSLLFRSYGHGDRTASIYAGLAANDSLIILDEAHCAVPFCQTLDAIKNFRGAKWAEQPIPTPFRFTIMSATPPAEIPQSKIFPPVEQRVAALNHPLLQQRFAASKPAELVKPIKNDKLFASDAPKRAGELAIAGGKRRVAVMVNRVATAEEISDELRAAMNNRAEIILLTGRMRPLDRDNLVRQWSPVLKAGSKIVPDKPIILVTTQCLEVGADFSFDALVTECASLDALRQRFGRLNRLGAPGDAPAAILIRERDAKEPKPGDEDPVYGEAIFKTWQWLNEPEQKRADATVATVDFGINAMNSCVERLQAADAAVENDKRRLPALLAPTPDAPVLLPAHLDLLCQTAPRPFPEPDVSLFLHGKGKRAAEVRVVFRADLPTEGDSDKLKEDWIDLLSLMPPTSPEMFTVPLHRLRTWLTSEKDRVDVTSDVQGALEDSDDKGEKAEKARDNFLLWRGAEKSKLTMKVDEIRPEDVVVLPAKLDLKGLGQTISNPQGLGGGRLDVAERALRQARGIVALRFNSLLREWLPSSLAKRGDELMDAEEIETDEIAEYLESWFELLRDNTVEALNGTGAPPPGWIHETLGFLIGDKFTREKHPAGGWILVGKKRRPLAGAQCDEDTEADDEDFGSESSEEVSLKDHTCDAREAAGNFLQLCLDEAFTDAVERAAECHDLGKLDPRFQLLLHNGDQSAVNPNEPLAKSPRLPMRYRRRQQIRDDARLPKGFRHEFLSLQLAEKFGLTPDEPLARDLTLHLIASHHGRARPFAPVVPDSETVCEVSLRPLGLDVELTREQRCESPAHHLDSGVTERFWRLTRRFGWWGLAYLEAIFRLSDWFASQQPGIAIAKADALSIIPSKLQFSTREPHKINLDALDGSNPLAFLAALGTLRVLDSAFPENQFRLHWDKQDGAWRPTLKVRDQLAADAIVDALHKHGLNLQRMFPPELLGATETASPKNKKGESSWKDKLMFPIPQFRAFCKMAANEPNGFAEFAATWAGETAPSGEDGAELARKTRFDFTAGQQAFINMTRELRQTCSKEDLRRALFEGWRYSNSCVSMRWDPVDEKRQYALQAVDPTNGSENPPLADPGANFLAVEALPLFPLIANRAASQPGFSDDRKGRPVFWRWPIWTASLGLDGIRSVLAIGPDFLSMDRRNELGIAAIFQSAIVQPSGRYRCFTPARML